MKYFFTSLLCLLLIQNINDAAAELAGDSLNVKCRDGDIYPWFEGCSKYIRCRSNDIVPEVLNCNGLNPTNDQINYICPQNNTNGNCGYTSCTESTTRVVAFRSSNQLRTPYYGLCVKGRIIFQGKCSSDNNTMSRNYYEEEGLCQSSCVDGEIVIHPGCSTWSECIADKMMLHTCPNNAYHNGVKCVFNYICPLSNNTDTSTTIRIETTSNPTTTSPSETTSNPSTTSPPETTSNPTTTSPPETTSNPTTTSPPETTSTQTTTSSPETTSNPTTTSPPETTSNPIIASPPETTSNPTTTSPPETTSNPTTTSSPETTSIPTTTTRPETTSNPTTTPLFRRTTPKRF